MGEAQWMKWTGSTDNWFASLSEGKQRDYVNWMLNFNFNGAFVCRSFSQSGYISAGTIGNLVASIDESMTGTQELSSTSHQAPLPPVDDLKEEKDSFWNFYIQRQRHLMVTVLHVTWGGWHNGHVPMPKPKLRQTASSLFRDFKYFRGVTGSSWNKYFKHCITKGGSVTLVSYWLKGQWIYEQVGIDKASRILFILCWKMGNFF